MHVAYLIGLFAGVGAALGLGVTGSLRLSVLDQSTVVSEALFPDWITTRRPVKP